MAWAQNAAHLLSQTVPPSHYSVEDSRFHLTAKIYASMHDSLPYVSKQPLAVTSGMFGDHGSATVHGGTPSSCLQSTVPDSGGVVTLSIRFFTKSALPQV